MYEIETESSGRICHLPQINPWLRNCQIVFHSMGHYQSFSISRAPEARQGDKTRPSANGPATLELDDP